MTMPWTQRARRVAPYPLLAVLALAGCGVGDDYQRPEVGTPAAFAEPAPGQGAGPGADWWKGFGSADLDAYMAAATGGNFDLAVAVAKVRQADADVRINGASLWPTVDLGGDATRKQTPSSVSTSSSSSRSSSKAYLSTTYSTSLSASYELDFWGKNRYARESAEALATASRFDWQTAVMTVEASVATTYFDILGYQDRLAVARANLANSEEVLAAVRDRQRLGTATELDVAQQESVVAGNRAAVPPLEQTLAQDVNALAVLVGRPPEQVKVAPGTLAALTMPAVAPGLPSALLERRPDVRSAEFALVSANADLGVARAALFPSLTLTAAYGFESRALSSLLEQGSTLWSAAASLTQPIFHGGALEGGVELKEGRYQELVADYRKAVISAFSDVEDALVAVRRSGEQEQAQQVAEATSRRAYDMALDQFRAGTTDIVTLLNVQKTLFSAEDSLVQARLAHLQAVVGLVKALGGGWDGEVPAVP